MIAAGFLGVKKRIYTCRGFRFEHEKGFLRRLLIFLEKVTVLFAHKVVCISPSVQSLGIKEGIFKKGKTLITHKGSSNGVNLDLFNPETIHKTEIDQIKKTYNINKAFVIGYVGRIIERKGIKEFFDSFKVLYSENKNLRLFIVGRPYYDQLSNPELIKEMENHPGVILAGLQPINKVPLFLSVFDLFVLPAYWEGFGNVLVQAAAMGLPVISTDATGTKDAVNNGFNGILVKPKSINELSKAIRLLYEDTALREKMGKNGIIWAKNFDRKLIWKSLEEIYQA
jgi:glycosyltransferase involved in cell wall biosynthesis